MPMYARILVALDFSVTTAKVAERAKGLAEKFGAELRLLHVMEYIPPLDPSGDLMVAPIWDVDERELLDMARRQLTSLAEQQGLADHPREVLMGNPRHEIPSYAEEQACDLIVIGSHGRRGIGRLLGSTANGVLHRAQCDCLAVRAEEEGR